MTAPKRMALAFCCMLLGILSLGAWGAISTAIHYGPRYVLPALQMLPVYILFAFPGWILALPFVLLFKDANGRNLWWILAIGTAIGPAFMSGWSLLASGGRWNWQANGSAVAMSIWIGFLTTISYVVLLRRFTRRGIPSPSLTR
jgi:hypothetical protein